MTLSPEEIFFRAFRAAGFRHLRTVAVELHGEDRAGQLSLRRRAGLRVAHVPPHLDLCAHRPHQEAARTSRARRSACRNTSSPPTSGRARSCEDDLRREAVRHSLGSRRHRATPGRPEKITIKLPAGVRLDNAPEGKTISQLLRDGEIDGFIAPRPPALPQGQPNIGWLFPRSGRGGEGLLQAHRHFPDHASDRRAPRRWPRSIRGCPAAVFKAFEQSKAAALAQLWRHVGDQGDDAVRRGAAAETRAS